MWIFSDREPAQLLFIYPSGFSLLFPLTRSFPLQNDEQSEIQFFSVYDFFNFFNRHRLLDLVRPMEEIGISAC